jgi:hypothetical protein
MYSASYQILFSIQHTTYYRIFYMTFSFIFCFCLDFSYITPLLLKPATSPWLFFFVLICFYCRVTEEDQQEDYANTHIPVISLPAASQDPRYIPSRVVDPDPKWIRIQSGQWIRIRTRIRDPDPDPGGQK